MKNQVHTRACLPTSRYTDHHGVGIQSAPLRDSDTRSFQRLWRLAHPPLGWGHSVLCQVAEVSYKEPMSIDVTTRSRDRYSRRRSSSCSSQLSLTRGDQVVATAVKTPLPLPHSRSHNNHRDVLDIRCATPTWSTRPATIGAHASAR